MPLPRGIWIYQASGHSGNHFRFSSLRHDCTINFLTGGGDVPAPQDTSPSVHGQSSSFDHSLLSLIRVSSSVGCRGVSTNLDQPSRRARSPEPVEDSDESLPVTRLTRKRQHNPESNTPQHLYTYTQCSGGSPNAVSQYTSCIAQGLLWTTWLRVAMKAWSPDRPLLPLFFARCEQGDRSLCRNILHFCPVQNEQTRYHMFNTTAPLLEDV